jgi:transcriptional regulator with XRE-family HTH domain
MALKEILQRNELTQEQTAREVGVSNMTLWNWANGRSIPTGENLARLLDFLRLREPGLDVSDLLPAPATDAA